MRRALATTLAVILMLATVGGSALAAQPAKDKLPPGQVKKATVREQTEFPDIGQAAWAEKNIRKMVLKGVFRGYDDGTFRPEGAVSRAELITLAVRVIGLEDEALARVDERLGYADWPSVPAWAAGYVVVAHEQGLLRDLIRETGGALQVNASASRLDVVVALIRSMGLADEAAALAGAVLSFHDAHLVPPWAVGFVVLAVREGIVRGYDDRTFRPNQPVKRAEMAALLDRSGGRSDRELEGIILAVTSGPGPHITLANAAWPGGRTFRVDPDALIYLNDQPASLDDLCPGDRAEVVLDEEEADLAVLIAACYDVEELAGTIESFSGTSLTLLVEAESRVFPLDAAARVLGPDGTERDIAYLEAGQEVEITVARGKVTLVRVLASEDGEQGEEESGDDEEEDQEDEEGEK